MRCSSSGPWRSMPGLAPGVARLSDVDEETRHYLAALVLLVGAPVLADRTPDRADSGMRRASSRFRPVRMPGGRVMVLPPMAS